MSLRLIDNLVLCEIGITSTYIVIIIPILCVADGYRVAVFFIYAGWTDAVASTAALRSSQFRDCVIDGNGAANIFITIAKAATDAGCIFAARCRNGAAID